VDWKIGIRGVIAKTLKYRCFTNGFPVAQAFQPVHNPGGTGWKACHANYLANIDIFRQEFEKILPIQLKISNKSHFGTA